MDDFSLSIAPIELYAERNGTHVRSGVGTGFFYKPNAQMYLITNWHIVAGVDPTTMQPVVENDPVTRRPDLPSAMRIFYKRRLPHEGPDLKLQTLNYDIGLYTGTRAVWSEHSTRQNVDVVAIELDPADMQDFSNLPINTIEQERNLTLYAGMDCFVLGYPMGMIGPGLTPIWKRASIATEPSYSYRDKPGFLIDTATREGMSGSPVIARHSGFFSPGPGLENAKLGTMNKFIGIYSGRIGNDPLEVQLGMVWRSDVLDDVVSGNTEGVNPCRW
jgi:hypothetical protein